MCIFNHITNQKHNSMIDMHVVALQLSHNFENSFEVICDTLKAKLYDQSNYHVRQISDLLCDKIDYMYEKVSCVVIDDKSYIKLYMSDNIDRMQDIEAHILHHTNKLFDQDVFCMTISTIK